MCTFTLLYIKCILVHYTIIQFQILFALTFQILNWKCLLFTQVDRSVNEQTAFLFFLYISEKGQYQLHLYFPQVLPTLFFFSFGSLLLRLTKPALFIFYFISPWLLLSSLWLLNVEINELLAYNDSSSVLYQSSLSGIRMSQYDQEA